MPEKTEEVIEEQNIKGNSKCKKILMLFRNIRKENAKSQLLGNGKKEKKKRSLDLEERREMFKKNMENSWTELPNTLQRKKEKISQEILSEYHESDSNDSEEGKFGKKSKERSYDFSSGDDEPRCEYFRKKDEDEIDAISINEEKHKVVVMETKPQMIINCKNKKNYTSDLVNERAEVCLEKIKTVNEDDNEREKKIKKENSYDTEAAVDEINLLFHDLITENGNQVTDSSTASDSGNSDTYVNMSFHSKEERKTEISEIGKEIKSGFRRSDSSDSLLNGSSASFSSTSELSQQEGMGKMGKGTTSDFQSEKSFEQNAEVTYGNEINDAKTTWKSCCEETVKFLDKINKNENKKESSKDTTQYSDIIFTLPTNAKGLFVNEHFKGDLTVDSLKVEEQKDSKPPQQTIIYQELDFDKQKTENGEEKNVKENTKEEGKIILEVPNLNQTTPKGLSEEQKAKKKSAEAIAKELSSQIFSKRNQNTETLESSSENKTIITISSCDVVTTEPLKEEETEKKVCSSEEKKESSEESWEESKEAFGGSDLQCFSVAEWRKAVAMGSKRGVNSVAMETIVEEPETDTSTKLTVREILRRFEELGNKHFNDSVCMSEDERTATLKQIHQTLKCLEEKVKNFEIWNEANCQHQQYLENNRNVDHTSGGWTGRGPTQRAVSSGVRNHQESEEIQHTSINDGKHSLLQFAIYHFRQSPEKFEMLKTSDGSISGSLKVIESKNKKNKEKHKGNGKDSSEWTWKEQVDLVKFTAKPIEQSLLQLDTPELSDLAVECFICLMRYMGDLPMPTDVSEVKCVYTILMHCHKYEQLRDEVYCQLMKQTTNNKSIQQESCQRGWRLFSIVAAYFVSSDTLKPFLFKYLETAAYDKRRAYHGTAMVCLQNLRKTFKYGGRKNVPSVEEITAISAGRNSKRQIYRLPGGTEKVVNTKSTTVVQDVIEELCVMINVTNPQEMEEFSVYCIVEGDTFTMPLAREEYILDVTTELHKNHQVFYLIFCRSVWYFPLRLDSQLYVEVVFNQIAPDYLEGLLLIMPGESLEQDVIYDISKIAALLHRAADMTQVPTMKETKFLLPKPALSVRDVKPSQWVNMVQSNWQECENLTAIQAKAQVLEVLSKWPLFGSSFFAVKKASEPKERTDHILALNRNGVHFIDLITHETLLHYPFSEVISTRKVKSEDGTLFLDMKCGNLMQQRITRLQTDQAHEISRLIRQYITMQQRMGPNQM